MTDNSSLEARKQAGPFGRTILRLIGIDEETLRDCPQHDWDCAYAIAGIMLLALVYQTSLMSIVGHRLFAPSGQIKPEIVLAALFFGTFVLSIDSFMINRSGFHISGIEELLRAGFDISGGRAARIKAGIFLAIRIILSIGMAQLTAIFMSLIVFGSDISARIQESYNKANAPITLTATNIVDAEIARATANAKEEIDRNATLSSQLAALRQGEIDPASSDGRVKQAEQELATLREKADKADNDVHAAETFMSNEAAGIKLSAGNSGQVGNGPRHRAAVEQLAMAKQHSEEAAKSLDGARGRLETLRTQSASQNDQTKQQAHDRIPGYEASVTASATKLADLNDHLAKMTAGREDAIRQAVERAPSYTPPNSGFLAQIRALEQMSREDSKIGAVIILIDVVSFGFELAAVLAKVTSFVPTTYAALLARNAFMNAVHIVDGMAKDVSGKKDGFDGLSSLIRPADNDNEPADIDAYDFQPASAADDPEPPPPPRRGRGRPRKPRLH